MENLTDALRTDPVFLKAAGKYNQDPETYWSTLSPQAKAMHVNRMAATPPVLDTKPAPTSMEEMNYQDFLNSAQNPSGVPAGAEFPALNSAMETGKELQGIDTELKRRQTESMAAIDEGLLNEQVGNNVPSAIEEQIRRQKGRETAPSQIGNNPPIGGALSGSIYNGVDPRGDQIPPPVLSDRVNDPRGPNQIPDPVGVGGPILTDRINDPRGPHQIPKNPTMPVLTDPTKQGTTGGILSTTVGTGPQRNNGNARGSRMSFNKIGSGEDRTAYANTPRGEMLMRVGGKIAAGSANGYNSAMNDGIQEYGAIKDADRARDTEAYLEQVRQQELDAANQIDASGATSGDADAMNLVNDTMANYQSALSAISDSRASGGNLTGIGGIAKSFVDTFTGSPDAARRLILQRVRVDDALLRVAETKGAISNAEMKLFLAPAPRTIDDEKIWEAWIRDRMSALEKVQTRLRGGTTVPETERPTRNSLSEADMAYLNN